MVEPSNQNNQNEKKKEEHPQNVEGESQEERQKRDAEWREKKEAELPMIVRDATSVLLTRSHDDSNGSDECSYCFGKRQLFSGEEETGLKYHKLGFTTNKFKVSDYEQLLQQGFTRCGTYVYIRNQTKSCCEIYQYKVAI